MSAQSFEENIAAMHMQPLSIRLRLSAPRTSKKSGKHRVLLSKIRMNRAHILKTKLSFYRMRVTISCLLETVTIYAMTVGISLKEAL